MDKIEHDIMNIINWGLSYLPGPKVWDRQTDMRLDNSWYWYHVKTEFNNCFITHFQTICNLLSWVCKSLRNLLGQRAFHLIKQNNSSHKTKQLQVVMSLYSNGSQKMAKCGENIISDTFSCTSCAFFLSYHMLISPVIYYWTDIQQHRIYLLNLWWYG